MPPQNPLKVFNIHQIKEFANIPDIPLKELNCSMSHISVPVMERGSRDVFCSASCWEWDSVWHSGGLRGDGGASGEPWTFWVLSLEQHARLRAQSDPKRPLTHIWCQGWHFTESCACVSLRVRLTVYVLWMDCTMMWDFLYYEDLYFFFLWSLKYLFGGLGFSYQEHPAVGQQSQKTTEWQLLSILLVLHWSKCQRHPCSSFQLPDLFSYPLFSNPRSSKSENFISCLLFLAFCPCLFADKSKENKHLHLTKLKINVGFEG